MNFTETLRLALSSIGANKLRSSLTMIGIAVGVFSVIGVMTVITALRSNIESGLNVLGANSFQFTKNPAFGFNDPRKRFASRRNITYAQAARFKELMREHARVSLQVDLRYRRVSYLGLSTNPNVGLVGSDENFVVSRNFDIATGRNLGPDDVEFGRAVVVLGADIASRLFSNDEVLGKPVRIDGQRFTVVGLLAPKGNSFGQSQDNIALIPITRCLDIYGHNSRSIQINVQASSQAEFTTAQDIAIGFMRLVRGLAPEDYNDFEEYSNETLIKSFNKVADVITTGAFVISSIALLASGVGVMNIMLVNVTERTKEIGIRKSIGAKKRNILVQFLIEAVMISMAGGLAGITLGVVGGNAIAYILDASMVFPWIWAFIGISVCSAIGIGFGFYPAWKAASLDPIEALRFE